MVGPPRGSIATIMNPALPLHPYSVTRALHCFLRLLANFDFLVLAHPRPALHRPLKSNVFTFEAGTQHAH